MNVIDNNCSLLKESLEQVSKEKILIENQKLNRTSDKVPKSVYSKTDMYKNLVDETNASLKVSLFYVPNKSY